MLMRMMMTRMLAMNVCDLHGEEMYIILTIIGMFAADLFFIVQLLGNEVRWSRTAVWNIKMQIGSDGVRSLLKIIRLLLFLFLSDFKFLLGKDRNNSVASHVNCSFDLKSIFFVLTIFVHKKFVAICTGVHMSKRCRRRKALEGCKYHWTSRQEVPDYSMMKFKQMVMV